MNQSQQPSLQTSQGTCPKCNKPRIQEDTCVFCGIVFSRYQPNKKKAVVAKAPLVKKRIAPLGIRALGHHARFFRQVAKMLGSGYPLTDILQKLHAGHPHLKPLLEKTIDALDKGHSFTQAFAVAGAKFPSFVWGHLEAGEQSGRLEDLLVDLANELEARRQWMLKQIFNFRSLWLIAVLIFAALSLAVTESVRHLDVATVDKGQMAILGSITQGAASRGFIYLLLIGLGIFLFALFQIKWKHQLTQRVPAFESYRLNAPLFGKITQMEALSRYANLLSKLIASGLTLPKSLKLAQQDLEFPSWQEDFERIQQTIDKGGSLAEGFRQIPHLPPALAVEIEVGERTGTLSESLASDAKAMKEQVQQLRQVVQVIFLVTTVLFGALLTIVIFVRGMGAWIPIYEKVLYG